MMPNPVVLQFIDHLQQGGDIIQRHIRVDIDTQDEANTGRSQASDDLFDMLAHLRRGAEGQDVWPVGIGNETHAPLQPFCDEIDPDAIDLHIEPRQARFEEVIPEFDYNSVIILAD